MGQGTRLIAYLNSLLLLILCAVASGYCLTALSEGLFADMAKETPLKDFRPLGYWVMARITSKRPCRNATKEVRGVSILKKELFFVSKEKAKSIFWRNMSGPIKRTA